MRQGSERVRERVSAKTREEGNRLEREIRARLARGERGSAKAPTFREWSKEFLSVYAASNNKRSEQISKKQIIDDHLVPFFGDARIDRIGVGEIEKFKAAQLASEAAPKSINNRLTVLRRMFAVAHEWGRIGAVPRVQWVKLPPRTFRFLSFEEAERLVAGAGETWRPMILLALRTGLRHGELLALRWEDVDLGTKKLHVRRTVWRGEEGSPKGGRARVVPLSSEALAALERLVPRERGPHAAGTGYVFSDEGRRLTAGETKWPLWSACKAGDVARCGWHVLRHTFASHLVMRGVVLKAVQELLGHATIEMTMRYAHLAPAVLETAVSRLDSSADTAGQ